MKKKTTLTVWRTVATFVIISTMMLVYGCSGGSSGGDGSTEDTGEISSIQGNYFGSYSIAVSNCLNPSDNGTYYAILEMSITTQTGNTFSGSATDTFYFDGFEVMGHLELSGTITETGQINGTTSHTLFDTEGEGTFTGQLSGNTLTIENPGYDTYGDTCTYTRTISVSREGTPPTPDSGGSGNETAALAGTYIINIFSGGGSTVVVTRLEVIFDGAGNATYTTLAQSDGDLESETFSYTVYADGTMSISDSAIYGIVNPDGNSLTLSDADVTTEDDALMVGIKKGSNLSEATLDGTYIVNEFRYDDLSEVTRAEIYFDGAGKATFEVLVTSEGDLESGTLSYTVAADGRVSLSDAELYGIVSADGNSFTLSDSNHKSNIISLF